MSGNPIIIRPAVESDAAGIRRLLDLYAAKQIVLPRSEEEIRSRIDSFIVAQAPDGAIAGCVALRDFGNHLYEVRSLVVDPGRQGGGLGRRMVEKCIDRLKSRCDYFRLFALTYQDVFFRKLGFKIVYRERFPEKIWSDCAGCPKKDCCDEIAVLYMHPED